ncbi:hypothetical protein ABJI51_24730 [Amycolatopsis sp. NEAU-NG30]|uniref:Uncharacterized protein n=1 Tax=Amycolatopsis melonis TaxID=3156488 RepID=A0ABV0LJ29_9PSEU
MTLDGVKPHWWRIAVLVPAVVIAAFSWKHVIAGTFALLPVVVWCSLARTPRTGLAVGAVLLALMAWFVLPRELGLAGSWVPAKIEVYWLHTTLAAVVCAIAARRGGARLASLVCAGFLFAGASLFAAYEAPPGDEGVTPAPAQLAITEQRFDCGSHQCWQVVETAGTGAPEVLREHLLARNFTPAPALDTRVSRFCRTTGLVVDHKVCADVTSFAPDTARLEWYVN